MTPAKRSSFQRLGSDATRRSRLQAVARRARARPAAAAARKARTTCHRSAPAAAKPRAAKRLRRLRATRTVNAPAGPLVPRCSEAHGASTRRGHAPAACDNASSLPRVWRRARFGVGAGAVALTVPSASIRDALRPRRRGGAAPRSGADASMAPAAPRSGRARTRLWERRSGVTEGPKQSALRRAAHKCRTHQPRAAF